MTLGLLITILLAILDYTGQAQLSLFQILLPVIIEVSIYVIVWVLIILGAIVVGSK